MIARNLGISPKNDFAMLEQIGGECAGAVTFMPAGTSLPEREDDYRPVTDKELADILKMLPRHPLMAGEDGVRLSLAGAQDKIAVSITNGKIFIPLGGAPSTHILKPAIAHFEGTVFNEALCMNLARAIGIPTAQVQIGNAEGIDYLLVERYDRKMVQAFPGGPQLTERLHQEDFCQALGIISEHKYQNEGGPSLKQCFDLVRDVSSAPVLDLQNLLDAVILNFLIGNHDAHGKNFSLTYHAGTILGGPEKRLAPLYDILCTVYYPDLAAKMAMKIGGEYRSPKIHPRHFERLAEEAGLAKPMRQTPRPGGRGKRSCQTSRGDDGRGHCPGYLKAHPGPLRAYLGRIQKIDPFGDYTPEDGSHPKSMVQRSMPTSVYIWLRI